MESAHKILQSLIENDSSPSQMKSAEESIAQFLYQALLQKSWFPSEEIVWGKQVCRESAQLFLHKLVEMKNRGFPSTTMSKIIADFLANPVSSIFLTPKTVRLIYSENPSGFHALIHEGVNFHCRLIRRAVSQAVRRHVNGMKRIFLDIRELEDELFGIVTEELVRCLSDPSARIWIKENPLPEIFPSEGTRGMMHGMVMHVALSRDGKYLAAIRSDLSLLVWDIAQKELSHSWDLTLLDELGSQALPDYLYFSQTGTQIAIETKNEKVIVFSLQDREHAIQRYDESTKNDFLRDFGTPFVSHCNPVPENDFTFHTRIGENMTLPQYTQEVFDWGCDGFMQTIATASEKARVMPEWMRKAGLERAVFHIAQKRLIDLIRKRTRTNYACWRCGSMISGMQDTHCRRCGADFTHCPLGCETDEPLGVSNRWQCPHCGMASRSAETAVQVEVEDWYADAKSNGSEWRDTHDMERILHVLKNVSVVYKKKDISCVHLVTLKAEGKTNEEIGTELGVPRGTVDYLWNQCKQHIILAFGERSS